jgi:hypothetical protein
VRGDTRGWPESLVAIAVVIGVRAAKALARTYGGERLLVPRKPRPDMRIVRAIGYEAARRLARYCGGDRIYVAKLTVAHAKKAKIIQASGTVADIARRFGVSERWARHVRREIADRQSPDGSPPPAPRRSLKERAPSPVDERQGLLDL